MNTLLFCYPYNSNPNSNNQVGYTDQALPISYAMKLNKYSILNLI